MRPWRVRAALAAAIGLLEVAAQAADAHHYSFAYDQPHTTGYGIVADLFNAKLSELSHGSMVIDQFPGAQLGQEPQMLQKIRTGDIDFMISSTANAATVAPESGVLSIHYIFRSEPQLIKAIADARLIAAVREMFDATVTSLQTGVIDFAENGVNVYDSNKHYEVAPVLSMTEHEANNSVIWVSDKLWASLTDDEKGWVQAAANEVATKEPAQAIELDHKSLAKLQKLGVKVVTDVDKASFIKIAEPLQEELAKRLGPHAEKILQICRSIE